jgi:Tfp pilus assembly protein PilF
MPARWLFSNFRLGCHVLILHAPAAKCYPRKGGQPGNRGNCNLKYVDADRAMELLQKAVKAGYKDAAHMAKDTDLDPLRGREDFKKVLAELEGKVAKPSRAKE